MISFNPHGCFFCVFCQAHWMEHSKLSKFTNTVEAIGPLELKMTASKQEFTCAKFIHGLRI